MHVSGMSRCAHARLTFSPLHLCTRYPSSSIFTMQCNHRSWADFMVDQYVTEGRSLFLSRWAVMFVFPLFMFAIRAVRAVILFKRGKIPDKEKFNRRIDRELAASPQTALAVYPEGHRSTHEESLPLKRGMLHYAYSRNLPTQIVIGANKEAILSEKHQTARFNQTVAVGYSEVLVPEKFADFEEFMSKVQENWDEQWNTVFTAEWEGLPEFVEPAPQFEYPMDIIIRMLIISPVNIIISAVLSWYTWRCARFALSFLGPLQTPFVVLVASYIIAGFYLYSEPVDALTVHNNMMKQMKRKKISGDSIAADGSTKDSHALDKKVT